MLSMMISATNLAPIPGGTGLVTDYYIFTIPLDIGTGLDM
jgi:hypothetical protein